MPRGRPLCPRPLLAIYTVQWQQESFNFHFSLTSNADANY